MLPLFAEVIPAKGLLRTTAPPFQTRLYMWGAEKSKAEFQRELELPRIEGSGGYARVLVLDVHVGHVGFVDQIKHVHYALEIQPLAHPEGAGNAEIGESGVGLSSRVASQVAIEGAVEHAINGSIEETSWLQEPGG